jgi:putative membrane protein
MKRALIVAAGLGLILAVAIIGYEGFGAVSAAFAAVGLGLIAVIVLRVIEISGAGTAWWIVFTQPKPVPLYLCIWVRFIREAINSLLPVAQVGGEIAGARLIALSGVPGALAGASVLTDMLLQVMGLFVFILAGIGVLAVQGGGHELLGPLAAGAAVMGLALAGFFAVQRFGGVKLMDRAMMRMAEKFGWSALANLASLHESLMRIYGGVPRLCLAFAVHLTVWFAGALEVLLALHLMGYPVSYAQAVAVEGIGQAARAGAFLVPGALGVQEAGFVAVGAVYGIAAPAALALSLVKRVPEIVLGLPFLFAWHAHETKALIGRGSVRS